MNDHQTGGFQGLSSSFQLDQDFVKIQSTFAHGITSLQKYCQDLVRHYNETNDTKWLELRRSLLQQQINRFQSLILYSELCKNGLLRDLEQQQLEAPPAPHSTHMVPNFKRPIQAHHQGPAPTTARSCATRSGRLAQPAPRDEFFYERITCFREGQDQVHFVLENASHPFGSPRFWEYAHDMKGILWYYGQGSRATKTGYNIRATRQNLEVLEKAHAYLVGYKDVRVQQFARRKGLSLAERRREA